MAITSAQAQTTIDLGSVALTPGTQTIIGKDDTFSMNGEAFIVTLPPCPDGQKWTDYRADPNNPAFVPAYAFTGTVPDRVRFNWRDPVNGKALGNQTTALVCE